MKHNQFNKSIVRKKMMKKIGLLLLLGCCFLGFSSPSKGTITVYIENCKSDKGSILIALYSGESTYMKTEKAVDKKKVLIKDKKAVVVFENMPYNEYAFSLFHDKNNNDKLDTNLFGVPTEDYAFSNNVKGTFGPPSYSKSKFSLNKSTLTLTIKL